MKVIAMASSQTAAFQQTHPSIHYIWIGPLTKPNSQVPGHDVAGPLLMAKKNNKNPIYFWCLDAYCKEYQALFQAHPTVTVCSIEHYLQQTMHQHKDANLFSDIVKSILASEMRIKDRVIIKDGFSLYLLANAGGYILDTNILPQQSSETIELPFLPDVMIPAKTDNPKKIDDIDCWILYSPKANLNVTTAIFSNYLKFYQAAHSANSTLEKYSEQYYNQQPAWTLTPLYAELKRQSIKGWQFKRGATFATIESLNLIKTFSNSHVYEMRESYDKSFFASTFGKQKVADIFLAAGTGNVEWLKQLIEHKADVNAKTGINNSKGFDEGETPLVCAIKYGHVDAVKILLDAKADPDINIYYSTQPTSARKLMLASPQREVYLELLKIQGLNQQLKP
jgi:hypothetical protein